VHGGVLGPHRRGEHALTSRPRLFLTRFVPDPGLPLLREVFELLGNVEDRALSRGELLAGVPGVEALLCTPADRVDAELMDASGPNLRVISNYAVGYDNVDIPAATARGILVTNTPGVLTETTADLAWALILGASRRVAEGDALVRRGDFHGIYPTFMLGRDVHGKTLGIVGMGRIGMAVARRAFGFGMPVLYVRRSGPVAPELVPAGASWQHRESLDLLLAVADIVSVHVPLSPVTRHLIGAPELALMRPGSVLVNTSRGAVLDEPALVDALRTGPLGAAGLDVYEDEPRLSSGLADMPNTVLLPHVGSATVETRGRMAELAVRNAIAAVRGGSVPHPVNPDVLARQHHR
jgi:glyoxylate reductase